MLKQEFKLKSVIPKFILLLYHAACKARNEQVGKARVKGMHREIKRVKGFVQSKISHCK